ncbi:MAG: ribonuclease catalytic domain-containing protein [Persicimonas sp.]
MEIGEIIEFESGDEFRLGTIVGEIGKKKLEVVTADGDEMRTTRSKVSFETGIAVSDPSSAETARRRAQRFADRVDELADEIDLAMLWEFVTDMGDEPVEPRAMAELYFASTEPAERLALVSVLRDDIVYFKQKKGPRFEPRSASQVEQLKRQREAELEKERERKDFVDDVARILKADKAERTEVAAEKLDDPNFRRLLRIIEKYALHDRDYDDRDKAIELLDQIEEAAGRPLTGQYNLRAFNLLVEMTHWDEHENLHLRRYHISTETDEEVLEAAEAICEEHWEPESWRRDLTGVESFSIDAASTRDIDDAVSCEPLEDGGWRVGVHIADPSACVANGSRVDLAARDRGTSLYLPSRNVPMFPQPLSHGRMSLVADKLRPAVSTLLTFDENFELVDTEVAPSVVRVDHRLTYEEVERLLDGDEEGSPADRLATLRHIADELRHRRFDAGAVDINLPDPDLSVDLSGEEPCVECGVRPKASRARGVVSELMITSNHVMGRLCREHDLPTIYRAQDPPEDDLYDDDVMSVPEGLAREFALVRKMKPGDVTTEPAPHFGLGLSVYVQATSPIRRYSDLVCQRQVKAFLADQPLPYGEDDILEILASVEENARHAKIAERETERYWTLYYLAQRQGEPLEATMIEHKDRNANRVAVFLHDVALKANAKFRDRVAVGEKCEVVVKKADPRKDVLHLRQA